MRFERKTVIVTGAGSGIGRATAVRFAREGASVIVADIDERRGRETEKLIRQAKGEATYAKTDVTKAADTQEMARVAEAKYGGKIDVLVNGAGVNPYYRGVLELTETEWDLLIDSNLKGTFLCCKAVLPSMTKQKSGAIINISSSAALYWPALYPAYTAAKMGVLGLTQSLAREVRKSNIAVLALRPVYVDTPMGRQSFVDQVGHEPREDEMPHLLTPEQIAGMIINMADPEMMVATSTVVDCLAM